MIRVRALKSMHNRLSCMNTETPPFIEPSLNSTPSSPLPARSMSAVRRQSPIPIAGYSAEHTTVAQAIAEIVMSENVYPAVVWLRSPASAAHTSG